MPKKPPPKKPADEKAKRKTESSPATGDITTEEAERRKKETMDRILERPIASPLDDGLGDPIGEDGRLPEGELSPDKVGPHRRKALRPVIEKLFMGMKLQLANVALSKSEEFHAYAEGLKLSTQATIEGAELVVWKYLDAAGPWAEEAVLGAGLTTCYLGNRYLERKLDADEKKHNAIPPRDRDRGTGERKDDAPQPPHP